VNETLKQLKVHARIHTVQCSVIVMASLSGFLSHLILSAKSEYCTANTIVCSGGNSNNLDYLLLNGFTCL